MTSDEAKQALKEGKKVRCKRWPKDRAIQEKIVIVGTTFGQVIHEDIFNGRFRDDEWEIVEDDKDGIKFPSSPDWYVKVGKDEEDAE